MDVDELHEKFEIQANSLAHAGRHNQIWAARPIDATRVSSCVLLPC